MRRIPLFIIVTAFCFVLLSGCGGSGGTSAPADQGAYNAGVAAYNAQSYTDAIAKFSSFVAAYPDSSFIDNAHYYLGKSLYHLNDPAGAIAEFDLIPQSSALADNALLWKGKSQQQQANTELSAGNAAAATLKFAEARTMYQSVISLYPASALIPDCHYQIGLTYFDAGSYVAAITWLRAVYTNYPVSGVVDGASYYEARSLHNLALALVPTYTFAQARTAYAAMMAGFPLSGWADNAQYQIGKTYYDELNYTAAITEFNKTLNNYVRPAYADSAQYYLARSVHELALLAMPTYTLAQARAKYNELVASNPASFLADNAQYQIGKAYYDELNYAAAIIEFNKVLTNYPAGTAVDETYYYLGRSYDKIPDYANARAAYLAIVNNYPASIYVDNAAYHAALTYHGTMKCTLELAAMQAFVVAYPSSLFVTTAQTHISDILLGPPVSHGTCI